MENLIEKNQEYIVEIIDNGFEGEGIAKINNFTIFIPNCIKGEKVKILIVKVLASHAFGKILEIIEESPYREESKCTSYKRCGGCDLRHIQYEHTLKIKQNIVQNLVNKTLKEKIKVQETIGMDNPYYYRNKAQYPIGKDKNGKPIMGVFAKRTHDIIPFETCYIQNQEAEKVAKFIFELIVKYKIEIYDEKTGRGLIRHIATKIGIKTNQIMCIIVINGENIPHENELVDEIVTKFPNVKTIVKNINKNNTNVIFGEKNVPLYGDGFIEDKMGNLTFRISPLSFYQINSLQAENLYKIAVDNANISKEDIVFDLYCGIGTISLFIAPFAKKVYGIEIVEEAINAARENAKINNINNAEFIVGDVEFAFDELVNTKRIIPDVIVIDPPRKGLDVNTIKNILLIRPKKIAYISCNPATLVRDLHCLEDDYFVEFVQPVDLFPWSKHVECVAVLNLK